MTLNFSDTATGDIKALARITKVSQTDKAAMAAMVAALVAQELDDKFGGTPIRQPQPPATKGEGG